MNKLNQQKFMNLFNDMLRDQNHNGLNNVLHTNFGGDEVDHVNIQKEQDLSMRLDERKILFLRKVKQAKQKILEGTYGVCEECDSDIAQKRLLARPMAKLCINCQEEKERNEFGTIQKRRDLTAKKLTDEADENAHIKGKKTYHSVKDIEFESVVQG